MEPTPPRGRVYLRLGRLGGLNRRKKAVVPYLTQGTFPEAPRLLVVHCHDPIARLPRDQYIPQSARVNGGSPARYAFNQPSG